MTEPIPSEGNRFSVSKSWANVKDMNPYLLVGILIAVGGVVWWYYFHKSSNSSGSSDSSDSDDWGKRAHDLLISRGYKTSDVNSAINHYLNGGALSPQDLTLISVAIRALGTPDIPNDSPSVIPANPWNSPGPSQPSGTTASTSDTPAQDAGQSISYWYVVSAGIGWTSTYRGISQQFYNSTSYASKILLANPNVNVPTVYGQIPIGTTIKVPRTVPV